jgi:hypothetical protein
VLKFQIKGGHEPFGLSVKDTAEATGESVWTVKQKLRAGTYKAKKSGRRTIVDYSSVKEAWQSLPDATFKPPTKRKKPATAEHNAVTAD